MGGQFFDGPDGFVTHPMSEHVRGALFNILGNIEGKRLLDPFSGSGAIGFEALNLLDYPVLEKNVERYRRLTSLQ